MLNDVCVAKFGTPNQRIETLFSYVPEIRSLGMLHYKMTKTLSLQAEEVMKSPRWPAIRAVPNE